MMVESELLGALLDLQDDQDRRSISVFGMKAAGDVRPRSPPRQGCQLPDLDGRRPQGPQTSPGAPGGTPRRKAASAGVAGEPGPVLSLDKRCLSCSGSSATVLAGFKLACLQYAPGPVMYQQAPHSRLELIRLRLELLGQAKEQLKEQLRTIE
mmetsp:Transcript_64569/g.183279  ORF Transcript_64569/g.183279 Transcript_64569/m.183279 type:complete len:153 (+) Transcript_64569:2-460(+)